MGGHDSFLPWLDELIADARSLPRNADTKNIDALSAWRTRVENFLLEVLGADHVHFHRFMGGSHSYSVASAIDGAIHQLEALRDDMSKRRLSSVRGLVVAEVFSDFLDMAAHLLSNGYKDAAASLVGAVLERGLRDIAMKTPFLFGAGTISHRSAIDLRRRQSSIALQKNLNVSIATRNHADHGELDQYTIDEVKNMHTGVQAFLSQYAPFIVSNAASSGHANRRFVLRFASRSTRGWEPNAEQNDRASSLRSDALSCQ